MSRNAWTSVGAALIFFGLLLLWLHENEARVRAQKDLSDSRFKNEAQTMQKENAVNELQVKVSELEGQMREAESRFDAQMKQKALELGDLIEQKNDLAAQKAQLQSRLDSSTKSYSAEIASLSGRLRTAQEESSTTLKAKSGEISELTAKVASLTKEKQSLEAGLLDAEKNSTKLEADLAAERAEKEELTTFLQKVQTQLADLRNKKLIEPVLD